MNECIKIKTNKYAFRNSPPYPANKCKTTKKKGNDGELYLSQPDKNGAHKWVLVKNKTRKNTTSTTSKNKKKEEKTSDLQMLAKKYQVTKSGSNQEIADRLVRLRGHYITNKKDRRIVERFLIKSSPSTKRWGFTPLKL